MRKLIIPFDDPGIITEEFDDDPRALPDNRHPQDEFSCLHANNCTNDGGHVYLAECNVVRCIYCGKVVA